MSAAPLRRVMRSSDLVVGGPGEPLMRGAKVGRAEVLLVRLDTGSVAAFSAHCPHQGTALDGATLFDDNLRCPLHMFLYDLRTGENLVPTRDNRPEALAKLKPGHLPIHRVEERDGWIWVAETPEPRPAASHPPPEQGPPAAAAPQVPTGPGTGGPISAWVGEEFELVLPTTPRPGHFWKIDAPGDTVELVGQAFATDDPPRQLVRLVARAPGEVTVSCAYATPWGPAPADELTFQVRID